MTSALRKFFSPPVFADDAVKTRSAYYINVLILSNIPVLVLFIIASIAQGVELLNPQNLIVSGLIAVLCVAWAFMKNRAIWLSTALYIIMAWIASTSLAWTGSGIRGMGFTSYFVVMLLTGLLAGARPAIGIAILSVLSGFGLAYAESIGIINYIPDPAFSVATEATVLFIFSSLFMILIINSLQGAFERATANAKELEASNRELTNLSNALEQRVQDRTSALEKRATQMEIVSSVARKIASVQDLHLLLPEITNLVSEQFGFYHVGIFLIDENNEFAELQAANSEGGKRMLARQHKLALNLNSLVGYAASIGEPRVTLDVGTDAVYFNNPDLPDTHSEISLPLRIGGQVIGVLDVQSKQTNAFTTDDINVLTILGDQVAIAIENSRLFSDAKNALATSQTTFEKYVKQEWNAFAQQARHSGFLYDGKQITALNGQGRRDQVKRAAQTGSLSLDKATANISVPIKLRGQTIGVLDIRPKKGQRQWTQDELAMLEAAAERAALALENARLVESAQRRALRERAIGEISAKIGAVSERELILQAAVEELGRKIGNTEIVIELESEIH